MIISVSNTITHRASCAKSKFQTKELEKTVMDSLEKLGFSSDDVRWNNQGYLEIVNPNDLKLHTLMLQMESLGLDLRMTKQTLIEVC